MSETAATTDEPTPKWLPAPPLPWAKASASFAGAAIFFGVVAAVFLPFAGWPTPTEPGPTPRWVEVGMWTAAIVAQICGSLAGLAGVSALSRLRRDTTAVPVVLLSFFGLAVLAGLIAIWMG